MTVALKEDDDGKLLTVTLSGKLTKEDYLHLGPECDRLIAKHGKIHRDDNARISRLDNGRLVGRHQIRLQAFHHIEQLALIGEKKWEAGMAVFCKPFTTAKVRYFERHQVAEAMAWLEEKAWNGCKVRNSVAIPRISVDTCRQLRTLAELCGSNPLT